MPHPAYDALLHEPTRLQIIGLLARGGDSEFSELRDALAVSDSALSKHLSALRGGGYVRAERRFGHGQRRTFVELTPAGRHAFCGHVAELQRLARVASPRRARR